jgi:D-glycero-beta-D-manno-heptose 1-phosphate adenylyltransferase
MQRGRFAAKIFDREGILAWVEARRAEGKRVGFTCGAFDILHAGHVEYLSQARSQCDVLLVAVNSDASIRSYKDPLRPVNPEQQRMKVVAALEAVDAVTLMEETRPAKLIELLTPEVYIKGGDYSADNLRSKPLVESYAGQVVCIPIDTDTSTTAILERAAAIERHEKVEREATSEEARLVFLDRDGTLIRDIPFLHDPRGVELLPGVVEGLRELQDAGFKLVIVTNQQGIGLGYYSEMEFFEVNQALLRKLGPAGIKIARVYYCPHSLAVECECRKPGTLLLERAVEYFGARYERCFFIGDTAADCEAAAAAGCPSVLVSEKSMEGPCSYRTSSFMEAVKWILRRSSTAAQMA